MTVQEKELVPGLAGVPAAESAISFIDGQAGILEYRGIRVETLAEQSTFEETAWLLLYGSLPKRAELDGFRRALAEHRRLPRELVDALRAFPRTGHPMGALQAAMALLGMLEKKPDFRDARQSDEAIVRILAATGSIIGTYERFRRGLDYLEPDPSLDTAGAFLQLVQDVRPDPLSARVLDAALVLHADHTMNASTFTGRVVASTEADPYTVCSSAMGSLTGPLHGGANERVLAQLIEIGGPGNVSAWVERRLESKTKIMGFGHRVYKTKDPRAHVLQKLTRELFAKHGSTPIYDTALELEQQVVARLGEKGIYPNVDFFSGIVYSKLGIPSDDFTPVFALSRVAGYLAHWREQMQDNKLFRPAQIYVGERDRPYVPIDQR